MAGRSCSFLRLCLPILVLVVVHAVSTTVAAAAEAPGHGGRPVAPDCWKTVMETPVPCARDVIRTLVRGAPHLSKECCVVLGQVGERCVVDVFSRLHLGAAYLPVVKRICGLLPGVVA